MPEAFIRHLRAHNRRALGWAAACAAAAAFLWALAYGLIWWLVLLAATAWAGLEAEMPRRFAHAFAAGAVLCLLAAALWRERPWDSPSAIWARGAAELVLAPARATWAALANLRAVCRLDRPALEAAWTLVTALASAERLEVAALPQFVPDVRQRGRVLIALQLSGLVTLRLGPSGWVALLADERARQLCTPKVRLDRPQPSS